MKKKQAFNLLGYALLGVALLMTLVIVACGGEDETPEPTPQPMPAPATVDVTALAGQMAPLLQQTVQDEMAKMQPPLSEDEIRSLIENVVSQSAPEGISSAQIKAMVDSAVTAVAAEGVNQEDVTAAIGAALAEAAAAQAEPLSQADIERIVRAAVATPVPTPAPTPAPTVAPTPTPAATMAPKVPVESRLKVSKVPPGAQVTMMWKTFTSETGPMKPMYEFIINTSRFDGEYEGSMLAEDWSMAPDARSWTLNLRQGIPFHSTDSYTGTDFTAKDFKFTLQTAGREDSLSAGSQWRNLGVADENFNIVNDHEVVWILERLEPLGEGWLSEGNVAGIISQDYWDAVGEDGYLDHPVGTGAFTFVELAIGSHMLYERVEDHWRKTPDFHELQFFYTPESATRIAKLLTKEVAIAEVDKSLLPLATAGGFGVATSTLPGTNLFMMIGGLYYDEPVEIKIGSEKGEIHPIAPGYIEGDPLRDLRVRMALNHAIDRDTINEIFFDGEGILQTILGIPPTRSDYRAEWTPYTYDPDKAKQLLTEAGYGEGVDIGFITTKLSAVPEAQDVAEAVIGYWREVGVNVSLTEMEFGPLLEQWRNRDMGQTITSMLYGVGSDPLSIRNNGRYAISSVSGGTESQWEFHDLDALFAETQISILPEDILRTGQAMGTWLYENHVIIPLFFLSNKVAYDPGVVKGYDVAFGFFGPTRYHEFTEAVFQ
jgi:ABC-type transport system substrate-binding protein